MNIDILQQKLLAAARSQPVDETVPYAFEQRILARIRQRQPVAETGVPWALGLWKACVPYLAITMALSLLVFVRPTESQTPSGSTSTTASLAPALTTDNPDALLESGLVAPLETAWQNVWEIPGK